jgi:hypothetical protein
MPLAVAVGGTSTISRELHAWSVSLGTSSSLVTGADREISAKTETVGNKTSFFDSSVMEGPQSIKEECCAIHGCTSFISLLKTLSKPLKKVLIKPLLAAACTWDGCNQPCTVLIANTLGMDGSTARAGLRANTRNMLAVREVSV